MNIFRQFVYSYKPTSPLTLNQVNRETTDCLQTARSKCSAD